jgi:H+/Cl- antiporter ClcA/CBS domain-containing protein
VADHEIERSSTTDGLPVAPSMGPGLAAVGVPRAGAAGVDRRVVAMSGIAVIVAIGAALIAQVLTALIGLVTNFAFYGRASAAFVDPAEHHRGAWVIVIPVLGAIVVGFMARYGSRAIRGHGIPEAMEQVLFNQSKIPARITFLKPLSSAVAIGTGGPFGAEGPIIATGGALGSVLGQLLRITADERKILLAAGAAAGMTATFGSPVAAVLLAIELLLFELRPRSIIPVALACVAATGVRVAFHGTAPAFEVVAIAAPGARALGVYVGIGALVGVASVLVTRLVYAIEDGFEHLPIHWMWWPAIGAIPVGIIGYFAPRTLGVGYSNIETLVSGSLAGGAAATLCAFKLASWSIALGSGTSGGTLAPLFTIGAGLGSLLAMALGVDVKVGALVGMAAMFAGASRALLASVVFAFETTRQPLGLLPLLGGCTAAYLVSCLTMKHSIMTEKIARRGSPVPDGYSVDFLEQVLVRDVALRPVVTLAATETLAAARAWLAGRAPGSTHQGFPLVDASGQLLGVLTRRNLADSVADGATPLAQLVQRSLVTISPEESLRAAADRMVLTHIGRLPVVDPASGQLVGILTRSDLIEAHARRLHGETRAERTFVPTGVPAARRT